MTTTTNAIAESGYYATTMTVADLVATVAMLRARHGEILAAHRLLIDYGVETQTGDVLTLLDAITAEAHELACRLAVLGDHPAAAAAANGWPVIHQPKASRS
jgi:hypothetical protein